MKTYELMPTNNQKSFYGKAVVTVYDNGLQVLRSYNTDVAAIEPGGKIRRLWNGWSATTGKHIAAFAGIGKKEYLSLPYKPLEFMETFEPLITAAAKIA